MTPTSAVLARPLLCGYYGEHNIGDDALLQALLSGLPAGAKPCVTAADQQQVQQRFGVFTCDRRRLRSTLRALADCDGLILGGGSLLQDSTSWRSLLYYAALILTARLQGKPVILWAQGLGPLRRRRSRVLVSRLLPLVSAASWRDRQSAALAQRLAGVSRAMDPVAADPVWTLPPMHWRGRGGPIVLAWRSSSLLSDADWRVLLQALSSLAEQNDRPVLWLPLHDIQDGGLMERLKGQGLLPESLAARSREIRLQRPEELMAQASAAGLVLAMRLHGLILAARAGAPVSALSYDPKVAAAAESLGCPWADLQPLPSADALTSSWQQQLDQPLPSAAIAAQVQSAAQHQGLLKPATP